MENLKLEKIETFVEFINENYNQLDSMFIIVESEDGIDVKINEGFVQDLQNHIRDTIEIMSKEFNMNTSKINKQLEKKLQVVTADFQKGIEPSVTANKLKA